MLGPADVMHREVRDAEGNVIGVIKGIIQNGKRAFDEVRVESDEGVIFVPLTKLKMNDGYFIFE